MKGITKSSTSLNPAFRWKLGRTVENTLKTKHKEITKEQHITQSLLYRWNWVGLLKKNTLTHQTQ
jgi:hypothetical protein